MFKPTSAKDRINYGEALMPPVGYRLERAVGTTYSLDLETLTAVSIALGLIEDTDSELISNPISMLSAFQKISDRITVFCEAGQIKLPYKPNALCLTLEKMVVPVALSSRGDDTWFPAFHPKTWVLEYCNESGEKKYRFVVMSRNMTFDHSWDVACAMDGDKDSGGGVDSKPISDFLRFLKKKLNKELTNYSRQREDLSYLIKALSKVRFQVEEGFSECDVLPLGIGANGYDMATDELFSGNFHELVVMSPFLAGGVIENLNSPKKSLSGTKRTLITRRTEIPRLSGGKASNFDVYVMKDEVIDGESAISDGKEIKKDDSISQDSNEDSKSLDEEENTQEDVYSKQDIHAKVYLRRKYHNVDLYLGSMNASYAAISSNVEMMLRLRTKDNMLSGERFLNEIMGEDREQKRNPFELIPQNDLKGSVEVSAQDNIERTIKRICRIKMDAVVEQNDERFNILITAKIDSELDGVTIRPLRSNKESELLPKMSFEFLDMLQLSEFYVVSASIDNCTLERVIMIPTSGMPEGRDTEIIRNVIRSKKQFIEYVSFILGDDYVQSFLENKKATGSVGDWDQNRVLPAVYEKMLKTSVSDPDRLGEIQYIANAIEEEEIIPPEFREMYAVFCNTLGIKQE